MDGLFNIDYLWESEPKCPAGSRVFRINDYPGKSVMHYSSSEEAEIFTRFLVDHQKLYVWVDYCFIANAFEDGYDCYNYNEGWVGRYNSTADNYKILEFSDFNWDNYK